MFIYLNYSVNEIGIGASIFFVPRQRGADQERKDKADKPSKPWALEFPKSLAY